MTTDKGEATTPEQALSQRVANQRVGTIQSLIGQRKPSAHLLTLIGMVVAGVPELEIYAYDAEHRAAQRG